MAHRRIRRASRPAAPSADAAAGARAAFGPYAEAHLAGAPPPEPPDLLRESVVLGAAGDAPCANEAPLAELLADLQWVEALDAAPAGDEDVSDVAGEWEIVAVSGEWSCDVIEVDCSDAWLAVAAWAGREREEEAAPTLLVANDGGDAPLFTIEAA